MEDAKEWFLNLNPRDQIMLVAGAGLVFIYVLLFLILFPMQKNLDKTRTQNLAALQEQEEVRQLAGRVLATQQSAQGGTGEQSLNGIVNKTLSAHGLTMESFQPSGNQARVRLGTSDFNQVYTWLHELEITHGVNVKDVTVTADKSPGSVMVNVQLLWGQ